MSRAHRKLQTQAVTFVRLVMKDTVEERCIVVQQNKIKVMSETLNDDSVAVKLGSSGALTFKDLKRVFFKKLS